MKRRGSPCLPTVMSIGALVGFVLAAVVSFLLPKVYESKTVIEVKPLMFGPQPGMPSEGETPIWLSREIDKIKSQASFDRG